MKTPPLLACVSRVALLAGGLSLAPGLHADSDYLKSVKPLLQERCYSCHGGLKQKGGLRLDTAALARKGGESGGVASKRHDGTFLLLERVSSSDPEERMPPKHEGETFTPAQVQILRDWIESGARGPADEKPEADPREHWAFRARQRPTVPVRRAGEWGRNPVDGFLAQGYAREGVVPQGETPPESLLRRLYMDLVGVPPTLEEIAAAEAAPVEQWYGLTVELLLRDPRYGQRWGRHWMDIWRYSDWWGLGAQLRNSQKHMWHWRDWIIESLNADTPYDEMIRLMLAADEIAPDDLQKLRATGFLARNWFLFNRNTWMEETVEHVGKGFLGLTFNCAKCHDHKYDPISHTDYYRMRAFFEPYHVRLDVFPGESNLEIDGVPRAYDGLPEAPTFRFVRGEESRPDKSAPLSPGVPSILALGSLKMTPIVLPPAAVEPERQAWVLDAHLASAKKAVENAVAACLKAQEKLAAVEKRAADSEISKKERVRSEPPAEAESASIKPSTGESTSTPAAAPEEKGLAEARAELRVAKCAVDLARAELDSVEARVRAMRAVWESGAEAGELRAAAVFAERNAAVSKQQQLVAAAALRLLRVTAEKRPAAEKEAETAAEALEKALKKRNDPVESADTYTRLYGAKWTPTRFLSSGKDDPDVPFPKVSTGRRKALAEWVTDARHPLTARVAANHIWARHMGTPLVANTFEFGRKSPAPSQLALLEWLAAELVDSGWSMKHLHRLILNSAAYRLSSTLVGAEASLARDPDNSLWWRRTPLRLEAEVVRDSILALAGELDCKQGGASIPASAQADSKRRSVYFYHSNNERNLFLTTFDEAAVKECYRRDESIVPQQALALTNSKIVHDMAKRIAGLLYPLNETGATPTEGAFIRNAYAYVLGIKASAEEVAACSRGMEAWRQAASPSEKDASALARNNLVWALLNHNDFVTLR